MFSHQFKGRLIEHQLKILGMVQEKYLYGATLICVESILKVLYHVTLVNCDVSGTIVERIICILGVFHLPQYSGNSGWDVNGTRLFGSSHWKISGKSGTSEKVVPFSRWKLLNGNLCSIYRISRLYHQFHAFCGHFKRPGFPELSRVSKKMAADPSQISGSFLQTNFRATTSSLPATF